MKNDPQVSRAIAEVTASLLESEGNVRKATKYLDWRMVVKCTAQRKLDRRDKSGTFLLTIGGPNYLEQRFLRLCKKAGEPMPVKKIQITPWPVKRKK